MSTEFNPDLLRVKAKRLDNGEWVEGWYSHFMGILPIEHMHWIEIDSKNETFRINPDTICRCTGRLVPDGRLVFEGDCFYIDSECFGVIVWDDAGLYEIWYYDYNPIKKGYGKSFSAGRDCLADLLSLLGYEFVGNIRDQEANNG